jgi:hypothetical protein
LDAWKPKLSRQFTLNGLFVDAMIFANLGRLTGFKQPEKS